MGVGTQGRCGVPRDGGPHPFIPSLVLSGRFLLRTLRFFPSLPSEPANELTGALLTSSGEREGSGTEPGTAGLEGDPGGEPGHPVLRG